MEFYRAVVQVLLFFVSETWVLSTFTKNRLAGLHTVFMTGYGETGKEEFGRYLTPGGGREHVEGGRYPVCKDIHLQDTSGDWISGWPSGPYLKS